MAGRIEDYALIGDLQTAALVDRSGSIDWCCFPRFDSGACFAALLGDETHGRWHLAPAAEVRRRERRYRGWSLVLETELETDGGTVRVLDFMPPRGHDPDIVRIVEGVSGSVEMLSELVIRFDYGSVVPWVSRIGGDPVAIAGPDALCIRTPAELEGEDMKTVSRFTVSEGDRIPFVLTWFPSHQRPPAAIDPEQALVETEQFWEEWSSRCRYEGDWHEAVARSLVVLKALTYAPTGGIVAAPTTSLPELVGGVRNWDYRYCWLRDATLTLLALLNADHEEEARSWRDWLLRAAAGNPGELHVVYGVAGERRLPELELDWLPGYEGSRPVRIGNGAFSQQQIDVYGEVIDALYRTRECGIESNGDAWALQLEILGFLEEHWRDTDEGIWEVRGPRRHFTHSKVMAWVAFDRAVKTVEQQGYEGPVERWRRIRDEIHAEVCREGFDAERGTFTQSYGSRQLDAALLLIPLVGFLPIDDERVVTTIEAIRRELDRGGFVLRYLPDSDAADGLPPEEGAFLPCTLWLAECLALLGRQAEAHEVFERVLAVRNDLGLVAEEYDPAQGRQLGNFPQAFTHLAIVNTAFCLSATHRAASRLPLAS